MRERHNGYVELRGHLLRVSSLISHVGSRVQTQVCRFVKQVLVPTTPSSRSWCEYFTVSNAYPRNLYQCCCKSRDLHTIDLTLGA